MKAILLNHFEKLSFKNHSQVIIDILESVLIYENINFKSLFKELCAEIKAFSYKNEVAQRVNFKFIILKYKLIKKLFLRIVFVYEKKNKKIETSS